MPQLPAICDNCKTVFPSGFNMEGTVRNVTLLGCKAGPCPKCGGQGSLMDGTFDFVNNTIRFIQHESKEKIQAFYNIVNINFIQKQGKESLEKQIESDHREFIGIMALLPENKDQFYAFLALLIPILLYFLTASASKQVNQNVINNIFNNYYSSYSK